MHVTGCKLNKKSFRVADRQRNLFVVLYSTTKQGDGSVKLFLKNIQSNRIVRNTFYTIEFQTNTCRWKNLTEKSVSLYLHCDITIFIDTYISIFFPSRQVNRVPLIMFLLRTQVDNHTVRAV